jgi:ubiquitin-conjugating enzyme E2 variant
MGLVTADDIFLSDWNASILGPPGVSCPLRLFLFRQPRYLIDHHSFSFIVQTMFDGRLFELRITCGPNYPLEPPKVRFVSRINLSSVNQTTGVVENDLPALANWNRNMNIESILVNIKNSMMAPQNRRLPQPPEGSHF